MLFFLEKPLHEPTRERPEKAPSEWLVWRQILKTSSSRCFFYRIPHNFLNTPRPWESFRFSLHGRDVFKKLREHHRWAFWISLVKTHEGPHSVWPMRGMWSNFACIFFYFEPPWGLVNKLFVDHRWGTSISITVFSLTPHILTIHKKMSGEITLPYFFIWGFRSQKIKKRKIVRKTLLGTRLKSRFIDF